MVALRMFTAASFREQDTWQASQTYQKDNNQNGTSALCLGQGKLRDFVLAGDKYYPGSVTVPQITAWHQGRPDSPWTVLGGAERSIKALEFIFR